MVNERVLFKAVDRRRSLVSCPAVACFTFSGTSRTLALAVSRLTSQIYYVRTFAMLWFCRSSCARFAIHHNPARREEQQLEFRGKKVACTLCNIDKQRPLLPTPFLRVFFHHLKIVNKATLAQIANSPPQYS